MNKLWGQTYNSVNHELVGLVRVSVSDENMRHTLIVTGKKAVWEPERKCWIVYDGEIERPNQAYPVEGGRPVVPRRPIGPEGSTRRFGLEGQR